MSGEPPQSDPESAAPPARRRDVLRWVAAGTLPAGAAASERAAAVIGASQADDAPTVTFRFTDVRDDVVSEATVHAYQLPAYDASESRNPGTTTRLGQATTDTGHVDVTLSGLDQLEGPVVAVAKSVVTAGKDEVWVGTGSYSPSTVRNATDPLEITIDKRLLTGFTEPYGSVAVWQQVGTAAEEHTVYVESRGAARETDFERMEARSRTKAGLYTLQVPTSVDVGYRFSTDVAHADDGQPHYLPPGGFYTDHSKDRPPTAIERQRVTGLSGAIRDGVDPSWAPTFPALGDPDQEIYLPYRDGSVEREQAERRGLVINIFSLVLLWGGAFATGFLAGIAFGVLGVAFEEIAEDAITSPSDLPEYAQPDQRDTKTNGLLPVDFEAYDFVAHQWRWNTYSFVQEFPLDFGPWDGGDADVAELCLRGSVAFDRDDADDPKVVDIQEVLQIDPSVRSPLDQRAQRTEPPFVNMPTIADTAPDAVIRFSEPAPTVGSTIELVASESESVADIGIESYLWTIEPPDLTPGVADVPGTEEPRRKTGEVAEATFDRAGDYRIRLVVEDAAGNLAYDEAWLEVRRPAPPEIPPVTTDAGGECFFPPTGDRTPATGEDAARHFGYGCGDWKVYEVDPGRSYTIATTIDGCPDCLLSDGTYALEEATNAETGDESVSSLQWEQVAQVDGLTDKAQADQVHKFTHTPNSPFIRIRNVDNTEGLGFYASVYGPRPD